MPDSTPPCGLYLRIAADPDITRILSAIREAALVINRSDYEQNMHVIEIDPRPASAAVTEALVELIKSEGLVALIHNDARLAFELNADGVMVGTLDELKEARAMLPEEKIAGLACGLDRELAMQALETRADCLLFREEITTATPDLGFYHWFTTMTDVPAAAQGYITNDTAGMFVKAGASFLDCSDYVWNHPQGVKQGVVNMLYAIDLAAADKPAVN